MARSVLCDREGAFLLSRCHSEPIVDNDGYICCSACGRPISRADVEALGGKLEPEDPAEGVWETSATVTITTKAHVRISGKGPHPDLVDWESVSMELDKRIEEAGQIPEDVQVDHITVSSETEPWT